jgi:predicted nucleic acid-binding protein
MQDSHHKVFLDSNIIIYAYSNSERAKQGVVRRIIQENYTVISTQVLQEICNILGKKFMLDYDSVKETLRECISSNNEVYTNKPQTVFGACDIAKQHHFSFYDSLIISSALESHCNILYSEDLHHNQLVNGVLRVINPFIGKICTS